MSNPSRAQGPPGFTVPGSRLSARRVGRLASSAGYAPRSPETEQQSNDDTAGRDNPESGPGKTNKFRQAGRGNGPEYDVSRHAAKCFPGHPGRLHLLLGEGGGGGEPPPAGRTKGKKKKRAGVRKKNPPAPGARKNPPPPLSQTANTPIAPATMKAPKEKTTQSGVFLNMIPQPP